MEHRRIIFSNEELEIYAGDSEFLYFEGQVCEKLEHKSNLTYLLKSEEGEEPKKKIARALAGLKDIRALKIALAPWEGRLEYYLDFRGFEREHYSPEFLQLLQDEYINSFGRISAQRSAFVESFTFGSLSGPKAADLTPHEEKTFFEAVDLCKAIGFHVFKYEVRIVETLGPMSWGCADLEQREILIARRTLERGNLWTCSTLIEEFLHLEHLVIDFDRHMQDLLLDKISSLAERIRMLEGTHER